MSTSEDDRVKVRKCHEELDEWTQFYHAFQACAGSKGDIYGEVLDKWTDLKTKEARVQSRDLLIRNAKSAIKGLQFRASDKQRARQNTDMPSPAAGQSANDSSTTAHARGPEQATGQVSECDPAGDTKDDGRQRSIQEQSNLMIVSLPYSSSSLCDVWFWHKLSNSLILDAENCSVFGKDESLDMLRQLRIGGDTRPAIEKLESSLCDVWFWHKLSNLLILDAENCSVFWQERSTRYASATPHRRRYSARD
jgi:hypothetical protein